MTSKDATNFKDAIFRYSTTKQKAVKHTKDTTGSIRVKCASVNCNWMNYGVSDSNTGSFHLEKNTRMSIFAVSLFKNKEYRVLT